MSITYVCMYPHIHTHIGDVSVLHFYSSFVQVLVSEFNIFEAEKFHFLFWLFFYTMKKLKVFNQLIFEVC